MHSARGLPRLHRSQLSAAGNDPRSNKDRRELIFRSRYCFDESGAGLSAPLAASIAFRSCDQYSGIGSWVTGAARSCRPLSSQQMMDLRSLMTFLLHQQNPNSPLMFHDFLVMSPVRSVFVLRRLKSIRCLPSSPYVSPGSRRHCHSRSGSRQDWCATSTELAMHKRR